MVRLRCSLAVVLVAAGDFVSARLGSPLDAWQQPLLRAVDTAIGIAVALAASSIGGLSLAIGGHGEASRRARDRGTEDRSEDDGDASM